MEGTVTAITTALEVVKGDALSVISGVAPIAIGISGAFMVWKFGMKFFRSLAK